MAGKILNGYARFLHVWIIITVCWRFRLADERTLSYIKIRKWFRNFMESTRYDTVVHCKWSRLVQEFIPCTTICSIDAHQCSKFVNQVVFSK